MFKHNFHITSFLEIFQLLRAMAMHAKRNVRWREYMAGKREWDSVYIAPAPDGVWKDPFPNPKDKTSMEYR